ncbi:MAG: hypothetical protein ABI207_07860 [Crocinitomicaceae bacterium]
MLENCSFIDNTSWGKTYELNASTCIHLIGNKLITQSENEVLLHYRKELQQKYSLAIHLWEDVLIQKKELVTQRLSAINGQVQKIHARKCTLKPISQIELNDFLNLHHIQGAVKSRIKYGLMYENELVGVASFSARRAMTYDGKKEYYSAELIRFCSKTGTRIYGGLDKLLKHYERNFEVNDIMTYADKDWSNGASYLTLGFTISNETNPLAFVLNENRERKLVVHPTEKDTYLWSSGNIKLLRNVEK